jgi:ABC-type branched-subunit amino acid transport system substrate-binding protein
VLTTAKSKSPDLLIALQSPEQAVTILRQADQLGVAEYGLNDTLTPDQVTGSLRNLTVIIPNFSPTFSKQATIPDYKPDELFHGEDPQGPPGAAIVMYYSYQVLAQAIEKAGTTTDTAAIAKALPGQTYDGPFGSCTMTKERELQCETLVEVVKGDTVDVLRFPRPDATEPSAAYRCRANRCVEVDVTS